jgi:photosystem II stability/assembly factor-like uncharacterized protein
MLPDKRKLFAHLSIVAAGGLLLFAGLAAQGCRRPQPPVYQPAAPKITPAEYSQLEFRYIGPPGNRVSAVAGVPGDYRTYYAGAASGGVWKSVDGGATWAPVFDDQPAQSIGALAVAPSDPKVVWAGTGESWVRFNISIGNGVYKSTDAGKTWQHMGLDATGRIARIVIHPRNPDIVFVAAMGHCYGPQQERGVFRTTDGGKTWQRVLFVDENTGASDIAMIPDNPQILIVGAWPLVIHTWGRTSGGPGGGLYMSRDGGTTWARLTGRGLPEPPIGKVAVAVAPNNPKRVYALIETTDGVLWRSDDAANTWTLVSRDHMLNERPHYYSRMAVMPDNQDEIYFQGVRESVSYDGGKTAQPQRPDPGGDNHDVWIDPRDANRIVVTNDHGIHISLTRGASWKRTVLPIAQMYHVYVDNAVPYNVYGNEQDQSSARGPSIYLGARFGGGGIPSSAWHSVGGNESGFSVPDPVDPNIIWSGGYDGYIDRFDMRAFRERSVDVWPECTVGSAAAPVKHRFNWTFPIVISPHDHNRVYAGSQYVNVTTDGGQSWKTISPDLSTNDKSKQQDSGGLTVDNHQGDFACVVFALAESPIEKGLLWAGTNDGLLQVTRDGGEHWTNVTGNIPNLPPWGTVSNIEPSRFDAGTAYLTVDFHQVNNRDPFVYKTADYGKTWKAIGGGIPKSVFSYAHWIKEDPVRKGMLYVGTENALYFSYDDGVTWLPLQNNLPHAPVHHVTVQENFSDLVLATYGRGFWILDDITPLRLMTPEVVESAVHLFPPRPAYLFGGIAGRPDVPNDAAAGDNPPYGASINFYLKSVPQGEVKVTILDEAGKSVRTMSGTGVPGEITDLLKRFNNNRDDLAWFLRVYSWNFNPRSLDKTLKAGINRVWWDLRYDPPRIPLLQTIPEKHTHVQFTANGYRPLRSDHMTRPGQSGPLVAPATYTVKLTVGGQEFTEKLVVKKDPNSAATEAGVRSQVALDLEIQDNINTVVDMIDRTESIRRQIAALTKSLGSDPTAAPVVSAAKELDNKLVAVEEQLFPVHTLTGATYDSFRTPHMLYERLCALAHRIRTSDFQPTDQAVELHGVLKGRMQDYKKQFEGVVGKDVPAFNDVLKAKNLALIRTEAL